MSRIRSRNTKPEIAVRKYIHSKGFRFRLNVKNLPGKPDIVLPKYRTVIFIHGCFWHGHEGCKYYVVPKSRTEWWLNKIHGNKANDDKAVNKLNDEKWKVIILWECELKRANFQRTLDTCIDKILEQ